MSDLISRQAAIEATWFEPSYTDPLNVLTEVRDRLKVLPSAQPEIIRCKDCKHKPTGSGANHDIEFPEQDYRCPCRCEDYWYSRMPDDDWFCANGERREDDSK